MKGVNPDDLFFNDNGYLDFRPFSDRFGFCSFSKLKDIKKCASYISKYVSKAMFSGASAGDRADIKAYRHLYFASKGLNRDKTLVVGSPVYGVKDFIENGYEPYENDFCYKVEFEDEEHAVSCVAPFGHGSESIAYMPSPDVLPRIKRRLAKRVLRESGLFP
ncbi:hypothetical protein FACS189490_09740 [Clostridia bacterium]|nr:hypothetical protein FACS189490_09740 [Clostridia bacterium]